MCGRSYGRASVTRAPTMLLLVLGLLHVVQGTAPPETLRKPIEVCPTVGYFFERQPSGSNPGPCYLCYCKGDDEAVCTLRDSERCDEENSVQSEIEQTTVRRYRRRKHRRRPRRSPGMMELFFNDPKKEQLLKGLTQSNAEDCVPHSSKSIGCPPKNWCTGCLVCDCDNDGQWQCHVMSFCGDDTITNKTPQPKSKTINKTKLKNITIKESKLRNKNATKSETKMKKRSMIQKKNNNLSIKKDIHKSSRSAEKSFDMTKNKTQPLISVKTKVSFARDNNNSKVIVVKKYISTLSPIDSPELIKYRNDPSKLAQILYRQYGSSTEANAGAIEPSNKDASTTILLNEFLNKAQLNFDGENSTYLGQNTSTSKQRLKLRRKSNVSRKARNLNEETNRITKMKVENQENKNQSSFYLKQRELMEQSQVRKTEGKPKAVNKEDLKIKREEMEKLKLIALASRRSKRDAPLIIKETTNSTNVVNETVNNTLIDNNQYNGTEENMFTYNKDIPSSYVYTVDSTVTNQDENRELTSDKYETTLKYIDTDTFSDNDDDIEKLNLANTIRNTEIYETEEDYTTTETSVRLDNDSDVYSNIRDIKNFTPETYEYVTETTTLTKIDYDLYISTSNKPVEITTRLDNESSTLTIALELPENEKQDFNITTENVMQNVISRDINTTITDLSKFKLINLAENSNNKEIINKSFALNIPTNNNTLNSIKLSLNTELEKRPNNYITKPKQHRMVPIKFLKKIYGKLLINQNNETNSNKIAAMESICDTFGPCQISTKNVEKINSKINQLISETKRSLTIIKTMKDLLRTIKGDNNKSENINDTLSFKGYLKQFNEMLTDTSVTPLTETQKMYNMYVKTNTTDLFDSIGKFAFILNDILKIIRSDKLKYEYLKKRNTIIKQKAVHKQLHKIKNIIRKFNIFQNNFMLKLYKAVTDLEISNNGNSITASKSENYEKDRQRMSINKYRKRSTYNVAKLKDFVPKMAVKERKKRNTIEDNDAIDYLLTLLEYMLKTNNPLNSGSVRDGIDLLVDAIRRAPNIKPIRKSLLEPISTDPVKFIDNDLSTSNSESQDDNLSFYAYKTENMKDKVLSLYEPNNDSKIQTLHIDDRNDPGEDEIVTDSEIPKMMVSQVTTDKNIGSEDEDPVLNDDNADKDYIETFKPYNPYTMKTQQTEDPYSELDELKSKMSSFIINVPETNAATASEKKCEKSILTNITKIETDTNKDIQVATAKIDTTKTESNLRPNFFIQEIKKPLEIKKPNIKTKKKKPKKLSRNKSKSKSNISSFTKEIDDENARRKLTDEENFLRKNILSSEDYDTMKSMDDESLSGDVSPFDPLNNEAFPSYFT